MMEVLQNDNCDPLLNHVLSYSGISHMLHIASVCRYWLSALKRIKHKGKVRGDAVRCWKAIMILTDRYELITSLDIGCKWGCKECAYMEPGHVGHACDE